MNLLVFAKISQLLLQKIDFTFAFLPRRLETFILVMR